MNNLTQEVKNNLARWIQQEYNNDILFDSICANLLEAFPSTEAYFRAKKEVKAFIQNCIPDANGLLAIKTNHHTTDPKIRVIRAEKLALNRKIDALYFRIGKKLGFYEIEKKTDSSEPNQTENPVNSINSVSVENCLEKESSDDERCFMCQTEAKDVAPFNLMSTKCCNFLICLDCYLLTTKNSIFNCSHCQKQTVFHGDTNDVLRMMGLQATQKLRTSIEKKIDDSIFRNRETKVPQIVIDTFSDDDEVVDNSDGCNGQAVKKIKINPVKHYKPKSVKKKYYSLMKKVMMNLHKKMKKQNLN